MKILAGAIGSDIHTAGILNFLNLARNEGYETIYIGSVIGIDKLLEQHEEASPDIVAVSYRLGKVLRAAPPRTEVSLENRGIEKRLIFGGTVETAEVAEKSGLFEKVFDGSEMPEEVVMFLRGKTEERERSTILRHFSKESPPKSHIR